MTSRDKQLNLAIVPENKYPPRDYQLDAVDKVFASFAKGNRRVLLQKPTGTGKTPTFCYIAREFLKQGEGVLVLAHRQELIYQAHEKIEAIGGLPAGIIKSGKPIDWDFDIQVASVQTLTRRQSFPEAGLVIVDEAHHACSKSYTRIFEAYKDAYILGVTATPNRSDGQGLKNEFDDLIVLHSPRWFIDRGFLTEYKVFASKARVDTTGVKVTAGDFNLNQLASAAKTSVIIGDVVNDWKDKAEGKQTVVFAVDVEHSKSIAAEFQANGVNAEHLDGETPNKVRRDLIQRFAAKEVTVICNCGIVTEGFDCPGIEVIQCVRPTQSIVLWLQMIGRGLRPSEGKSHAIILDHTYNTTYLGLPDDERTWSLEPLSLSDLRFNQECSQCGHIFRPLPHELKPLRQVVDCQGKIVDLCKCACPSCSHEFEFELGKGDGTGIPRTIEEIMGDLEEIDLTLNPWAVEFIDRLVENQQTAGKKPGWVYYRAIEDPRAKDFSLSDWRYLAGKLNYKPGWGWHKYQEVQKGPKPAVNPPSSAQKADSHSHSYHSEDYWYDRLFAPSTQTRNRF